MSIFSVLLQSFLLGGGFGLKLYRLISSSYRVGWVILVDHSRFSFLYIDQASPPWIFLILWWTSDLHLTFNCIDLSIKKERHF